MKILIRSEIVVEREVEITPDEFRRCYHADYGDAAKWITRTTEAKIYDKLEKLANVSLEMQTKVFVREGQDEHCEN